MQTLLQPRQRNRPRSNRPRRSLRAVLTLSSGHARTHTHRLATRRRPSPHQSEVPIGTRNLHACLMTAHASGSHAHLLVPCDLQSPRAICRRSRTLPRPVMALRCDTCACTHVDYQAAPLPARRRTAPSGALSMPCLGWPHSPRLPPSLCPTVRPIRVRMAAPLPPCPTVRP